MTELPLFPLNTVLFPGMPLRLHIFEERYKAMVAHCRATDSPFGVVLIQRGQEVGGPAEPHPVGCTAVITQIEPLIDGRMNILAVGRDRFYIRALKYDRPYLVGEVEYIPLLPSLSEQAEAHSAALRGWVRRYLRILSQASETAFDLQQLPGDPVKLAYLASYLIQVPPPQKQDLLAAPQADALVAQLVALYRREVTLIQAMLAPHEEEPVGPFSLN